MRWLTLASAALLSTVALDVSVRAESLFVRGEVDELTATDLADAVRILAHLFLPDLASPVGCEDALDVNDDGRVNIADPVYLVRHLFLGGAPPPPPAGECGDDPTPDELSCDQHLKCGCMDPSSFYCFNLDTEAVFFVIDRSHFMQGNGELAIAKREVIRWLSTPGSNQQFGIVFSDGGLLRFPDSSEPAQVQDQAVLRNAIAFVQGASGGNGSCLRESLFAALAWAEAVAPASADIVLVSGGSVDCLPETPEEYYERTLLDVQARNGDRAQIYTLGELVRESEANEFLGELAAQNGGYYVRIAR